MATSTASGNIFRTFVFFILTAVLIAMTVGATLYLQDTFGSTKSSAQNDEPKVTKIVIPDPLFTSLEPFTVSLRDQDGSRVLYVGITLRMEDEPSQQILVNYMPEVRDRVLRTLTRQSTLQVQAPNGREVLAEQLLKELSKPYPPNPEGPNITRVLFTAYVVQ